MKLTFYWFSSSRENWLEDFIAKYEKKINSYTPFEVIELKSKKLGRKNALQKIKQEQSLLLSKITHSDFVVLFDEKGNSFKNSVDLSQTLQRMMDSPKSKIILIVGGAYGLGEIVKKRAQVIISLSSLTMSHQVATMMALEQIYRAFTIINNHPYHNK